MNKASRASREPLEPYTLEKLKAWNVVAFDVAVLPWATMQYRYFLVIVDLFSKYIELVAMKNQEASTIKDALINQLTYRILK